MATPAQQPDSGFDWSKAVPVTAAPSAPGTAPGTQSAQGSTDTDYDWSKATSPTSSAPITPPTGAAPAAPSAWDRFSSAFSKGVGIAPPQNATEHVIDTITGNTGAGLVTYRAARAVVDSVENAMKAKKPEEFEQAKQDIQQAVTDFHNKDMWNLASSAGSVAGDVIAGAGGPVARQVGSRVRSISEGARPGGDLATPLGETAADAVNIGVASAVGGMGSAEAAPDAAAEKPGLIQRARQAVSSKAATQPGAQSALREGAAASARDAGVTGAVDTSGSIRTIMDQPIAEASKIEDSLYQTVNDAAGTDMKALYDRREELQDAADDPTNLAQKSVIQKELTATDQQIAQGEANVQSKLGKDAPDLIDQAKAATQQRYSMEEGVKKLFNNESVVNGNTAHGAPETINVDSAIKAAENLDKPSKFAPFGTPTRLEQMFGEDGAASLKQGLYDAQKAGQKVASRNDILKILKIVGITGGALGGAYEYFSR
jgi:hypothetical protein